MVFIFTDVDHFVIWQVRGRGHRRNSDPLPVPALFGQRGSGGGKWHGRVVPGPDVGVAADVRERGGQRAERALAREAVRGEDRGLRGYLH